MARWKKLLERMQANPQGHTYDDAVRILRKYRFIPPQKPKGSHRLWRHKTGIYVGLLEKGHGTLPEEYIKNMLEQLAKLPIPGHEEDDE